LGIVDDPFENWQQAYSETMRRRVVEWYRATFRTRIWEGGAIVVVATRWHPMDLIGQLLLEQGDDWKILRYPAIAESVKEREINDKFLSIPAAVRGRGDPLGRQFGEPLCPRRFSITTLKSLQEDVGPVAWQALYQQVPRSAEGGTFLREWFETQVLAPTEIPPYEKLILCRYWDLAATEVAVSSDPDHTCGALVGVSAEGDYYVLDIRRFRRRAAEVEKEMNETALSDGHRVAIRVEQEPGSSGKLFINHIVSDVLVGYPVEGIRSTGSKEVRAAPCTGPASTGRVYLRKAPWNSMWIDEVCTFPMGAHDDVVDSWSGAMQYLMEKRRRGRIPLTATVLTAQIPSRAPVGRGEKIIGAITGNRRN